MRILAVADAKHQALYSHFDPGRWRGVELLLGCGDLPGDYLDFLATSLGVPFLYVRGNHDANLWRNGGDVGENLDCRVVRHKGLTIAGFEGCAWYGGQGVEYSQTHMRWRVYRTLPSILVAGKVDLVVSHAPPALPSGQLAAVELQSQSGAAQLEGPRELPETPEGPHDLAHRGFEAFRTVISLARPRLWLHGHNHLNYSRAARVHRSGETLIANAYEYFLFDL